MESGLPGYVDYLSIPVPEVCVGVGSRDPQLVTKFRQGFPLFCVGVQGDYSGAFTTYTSLIIPPDQWGDT